MKRIKHTTPYAGRGFTIIETLVAISILVIALTGPLAIIAQALRSSYFARDQITAYYLAQEAVEYIRNARDKNGLEAAIVGKAADEWLDGVATDSLGSELVNEFGTFQVKAYLERGSDGYVMTKCDSGGCPFLRYHANLADGDADDVIYGGQGLTDPESIFQREIILSTPAPGVATDPNSPLRELVVTVNVYWTSPSGRSSVTVREHLTNWQTDGGGI